MRLRWITATLACLLALASFVAAGGFAAPAAAATAPLVLYDDAPGAGF
jgi:hypothetical protein